MTVHAEIVLDICFQNQYFSFIYLQTPKTSNKTCSSKLLQNSLQTDTQIFEKTSIKFSPATYGNFSDCKVSVFGVHPHCSAVVLSSQMYSDLGSLYHFLQGRTSVEVVVSRPEAGQKAESDVSSWQRHISGTKQMDKNSSSLQSTDMYDQLGFC